RSLFRVRRSVLGGVKMSTRSLSLLVPALVLAAGCVKSQTSAPPPASAATASTGETAAPGSPAKPAEPMPPLPPWKHGENIFVGEKLAWVDPYSPAHLKGMMAEKNKKWITDFATSLGSRRAAVILEPDSLGLLDKKMADGKPCLSEEAQKERLELLRFAVHTLVSLGNTAVYLDAGHSGWLKPSVDAKLLKEAGIEEADGFALNVSNYKSTSTEITYGKEISKLVGGKHFVIDTSRNGNGPPKCDEKNDDENCWCNPPGRALGTPPT